MKLNTKIRKIIVPFLLGLAGLYPLSAQVNEIQPDSTLQSVFNQNMPDTIVVKRDKDFLEAPVHYPARDSIIYSYSDNKIKMYGEAKVTFQDKEVTAEYIEMSMDKKEMYASGIEDSTGLVTGKPIFKDGDEEYEVTVLRYNFESGKAWVTDAETKIEAAESSTLHSHITKMDTLGNLHIKDGKFSTCEADEPHWYFAITKGIMTNKKSVVSGPAYLVIEGIPLYFLGLPFGFFPKQEKKTSGIIMPKFGEEANRGFYLRDFGYYFAGNDKMDLRLQGDIYSKGSWKTAAISNYKKRYKFNGNVGLTIAANKFGEKGIDYSDTTKTPKDFSINWRHSQDSKAHPYRNFSANVNFSSSTFDRRNTYDVNQRLSSTKSSSVTYSRKFPNNMFNFTAKIGATQNSQTEKVSMNLPSGTFTVNRFYPFKRKSRVGKQKWYEQIDMRYSSNFENRVNMTGLNIGEMSLADSMQNGFKHEIPVQASFKLIPNMTFTPSLRYQGLLFFSHIQREWNEADSTIIQNRINELKYVHSLAPNFSLSYSPRIYGMFRFKGDNPTVVRHVAKPSLSFSYRPDIGYDDSRYYDSVQRNVNGDEERYSIFAEGLYRLPSVAGRSGNASFRFGNNLEMKVRDKADSTGLKMKKVKLIDDFGFSTSYNVFKDSLNLSPLALNARTKLFGEFDVRFSGTLDPYSIDSTVTESSTRYYTVNRFEVANSGRPGRLTAASISMSFALPLRSMKSAGSRGAQPALDDDVSLGTGPPDMMDYGDYWEYDMPWSIRASYTFRYSRPYMDSKITQAVSLNGSLKLTPKWDIKVTSGYDFVLKEVTYTKIDIRRDLHCWEMSLNLVPFGQWKSYTFQLNVKSNMFKDVRFRKERRWEDNIIL